MTHTSPLRTEVRRGSRIAFAMSVLVAVTACTETGEFNFGSRNADAEGPAPIGATRLVERDVEAPEVFDVSDEGLWDGRPSLGGVWVAHPDASDPERVIIRNADTGRFVIGALFRRERENPGPVIQISSDAAAALDILAGDPTAVQVTALRREEVPQAGEDEAGTEAADDSDAEPAPLPEIETSALPADVSEPQPAGAPEPLQQTETASVPAAGDATAAPDRPGLLSRIFGSARPATRSAGQAAAQTGLTTEEVRAGIRSAEFSAERLDPIAAVADAAIAESEATQIAAATQATAPAVQTASLRGPSDLDRSFVQIGIFNMQENAHNTGQALRNAGLLPTIYDQTSNGRRFWRVVVGPAPNAEDRAAVLETVRGLGFEDAYFVTR